MHEGAVAFVADGHIVQNQVIPFQVRADIFKLDSGRGRQPVALAFRALQVQSGSAWLSGPRRTQVGLRERRVQPGAKLVGVQFAALHLVPFPKPFLSE